MKRSARSGPAPDPWPLDQRNWDLAATLGRRDWLAHWHAKGLLEQPLLEKPWPFGRALSVPPEADRMVLPAMVSCYQGRTALEVALQSDQGEYALALLDVIGPTFPKYFGAECQTVPAHRSPLAESPLELAVRLKDDTLYQRVVERLMEQGHCLDTDWAVKSPLEWCIECNRPEPVRFLLQAGATMQAASQPLSPLFRATELMLSGVAEVLLEAGADVNALEELYVNAHPYTALMMAAMAFQGADHLKARAMVSLLIEYGADPDIVVTESDLFGSHREVRVLDLVPSAFHADFREEVIRGNHARLERRLAQAPTSTKPRM